MHYTCWYECWTMNGIVHALYILIRMLNYERNSTCIIHVDTNVELWIEIKYASYMLMGMLNYEWNRTCIIHMKYWTFDIELHVQCCGVVMFDVECWNQLHIVLIERCWSSMIRISKTVELRMSNCMFVYLSCRECTVQLKLF
jgi:hypothetical protein